MVALKYDIFINGLCKTSFESGGNLVIAMIKKRFFLGLLVFLANTNRVSFSQDLKWF